MRSSRSALRSSESSASSEWRPSPSSRAEAAAARPPRRSSPESSIDERAARRDRAARRSEQPPERTARPRRQQAITLQRNSAHRLTSRVRESLRYCRADGAGRSTSRRSASPRSTSPAASSPPSSICSPTPTASALEDSPVRAFEAVQIGIMDSEEFENRANIADEGRRPARAHRHSRGAHRDRFLDRRRRVPRGLLQDRVGRVRERAGARRASA